MTPLESLFIHVSSLNSIDSQRETRIQTQRLIAPSSSMLSADTEETTERGKHVITSALTYLNHPLSAAVLHPPSALMELSSFGSKCRFEAPCTDAYQLSSCLNAQWDWRMTLASATRAFVYFPYISRQIRTFRTPRSTRSSTAFLPCFLIFLFKVWSSRFLVLSVCLSFHVLASR